ncbi:MAG TPA: DNA polymerase III subunit alpha, partial [Clostridiales bacterium]|nr:DNA polymerase III subunit alpha [Clostridiales bacterium]
CIVYQEQVLEIVRTLAGYSLGSADMLRRVISKKKADKMEIERKNFIYGKQDENGNWIIDGCIRRGIPESVAIDIFNEINEFANYAFNKSHAAAYAFITYQTAYLKTFYQAEYMASLISSVEDQDKINEYFINCKKLGIEKLPPDINMSEDSFTVEGNSIRFGLSAIKNVGKGFIVNLVDERKRNGKFTSFSDFVRRMLEKDMNKRAVEGLIKCGAFDSLGAKRSQLLSVYESVIESETQSKKANISGQMTLFADEAVTQDTETALPDISECPKSELLALEKESCGMYFSGHPMEDYEDKVKNLTDITTYKIMSSVEKDEFGNIKEISGGVKDGHTVKICGIIAARKNKITKNNTQMAFLRLEDLFGTIEVIVFPKILQQYSGIMTEGKAVLIEGRVSIREDEEPKILCETAALLDEIKTQDHNNQEFYVKDRRTLFIRMGTYDETVLKTAAKLLKLHSGETPVCFFISDSKKRIYVPESCYIDEKSGIINDISAIFGENNVKMG